MPLGLTRVVTGITRSYLCATDSVEWMYHSLFTHSSAYGHLGCLQLLIIY